MGTAIATPATARYYSSLHLLVLMKYIKSTRLKNWNFILSLTHPLALSIVFTLLISSVNWSGKGLLRDVLATVTTWEHGLLPKQGSPLPFPSENLGGRESVSGHSVVRQAPQSAGNPPRFLALPRQREKLLTRFSTRSLLQTIQRWPTPGWRSLGIPTSTSTCSNYTGACTYHWKKGPSLKKQKTKMGTITKEGRWPPSSAGTPGRAAPEERTAPARPPPGLVPQGGCRWLCRGKASPGQAGSSSLLGGPPK